jgi:hypothetical protein
MASFSHETTRRVSLSATIEIRLVSVIVFVTQNRYAWLVASHVSGAPVGRTENPIIWHPNAPFSRPGIGHEF